MKPSIKECDEILTRPGQVLEMEEVELYGRLTRVWKNAPKTFRSFLQSALKRYPDRIFISAPGPALDSAGNDRERVTFKEVFERAERLAGFMRLRDLGVGSKVAIGGGNSVGWVVSFIATHLIGGIAVCLNVWLPPDLLLHCLRTTTPDMVLIDADRCEAFRGLGQELASIGVDNIMCWEAHTSGSVQTLDSVIQAVDAHRLKACISDVRKSSDADMVLGPENDAVIFFSSGTSGPPKAVLSTQRMAMTNLWSGLVAPSRAALRAGLQPPPLPAPSHPQKTVLLAIPLFHVTGCLSWLMRAFFAGSKMVMLRKWDTVEAVKVIASEGVTVIGGVPAVVSTIVQSPDLPRETSFETVFYGGAPPSKLLAAEVKRRWPKAGVVQGYGLTETNAYVCSIAGQDYVERPDSTGPAVPVSDVRVIDPETRKVLGVGQTGLLMVRGPQVMKCYYNNPEATGKALDEDGWLDTGDVAEIDAEGFVYIRDRLKDVIIRGGENITSSEVENALYAHPAVSEAVALGLPDSRLGEVVGAIVSLRAGQRVTEVELLQSVKAKLPKFAWPAMISISTEPLPRNVNGKVVKKDLKPGLIAEWDRRNGTDDLSKVKAKL